MTYKLGWREYIVFFFFPKTLDYINDYAIEIMLFLFCRRFNCRFLTNHDELDVLPPLIT